MFRKYARTNVFITAVIGAMIVAMLPVVLTMNNNASLQSAEALDSMERPYVKAYAKTALYEPGVGKTNVFGPEGIFPFFNDTFSSATTSGSGELN